MTAYRRLLQRSVGVLLALWVAAAGPSTTSASGVGGGAASLPGGPGSFEGMGESFQPSVSTGTAAYSIGFSATVGVGGMAPHLSLSYEGGGGNGPVGLGWSFSPGLIQRRADKGIPRYVDGPNGIDDDHDGDIDDAAELDVFLSPSGEDLVPFQEGATTNYFSRVEGGFVRYRRVDDHWEATAPNGRRMLYGVTPSARIADPADPTHVFQWLLEREVDTHGNAMEYRYASFPGPGNLNEKFLSEVRYGPGGGPWTYFHFVSFEYEDRADWFEDCRAGFVVRSGKRLSRVNMGTQGLLLPGHAQGDFNHDGVEDNLNRRYVLGYQADTFASILHSVTLYGADGDTAYPSSTYTYTAASTAQSISALGSVIGSENEPPSTFENGFVDLVDLNGDGLPDLLRTASGGGGHTGYINQGQRGSGGSAILWSTGQQVLPGTDGLAWSTDLGASDTHLADIDGDGLPDLVQIGVNAVYYYRNQPSFGAPGLSWGDRALLTTQDFMPPSPSGDPDVQTGDLNFDKRIDIIKSIQIGDSVGYQIWFNLGKQKYSSRVTVIPAQGYLFSSPGVQLTDFNGDRVPDVVSIRPFGIRVTAGLGYGRFAPEVLVPLPDGESLTDDQAARARLEDINGDGLADLVLERAEPGTIRFWLNRGNYTLEGRREITGLPVAVGNMSVRWADMNGNGTVDLVVADDGASPRLSIVDIGQLMGCVPRANLLVETHNGQGGMTRLEYRSSTDYMLEDGTDGTGSYAYPWSHAMPFPVDVLWRQTVTDSLGTSQEMQFAYHDPYYDPVEKQFRGFANAERITVGDATSPTLVTRYTFDVGATEIAMKGRLLRSSAEQEDGKVFSETETTWSTRVFGVGINGAISRWAAPVGEATVVRELGVGTPRRTESETVYDAYGHVTESRMWGVVEDGNKLAGNDEVFSFREYASDTNLWRIGFPVRSELRDAQGHVITRTEHFYDDPTFSGANAGVIGAGEESLVRNWYDFSRADGFVRSQRTLYDEYGNPVRSYDPTAEVEHPERGHWKEWELDPLFHQYTVREIEHVGGGHPDLVNRVEYDQGLGVAIRMIDVNGAETRSGFDPLGRVIWELEPGDSESYPSREFSYVEAQPFGAGALVSYSETRILDRAPGSLPGAPKEAYYHIGRTYVDGLGRTRMTKSEAEPDPATGATRFVANGGTLYNAKGEEITGLGAFFSDTLAFEDITRAGWTGRFEVDGRLQQLGLDSAPQAHRFYDALGRPVRSVLADGSVSEVRYEPLIIHSFDQNSTDPGSPFFGRHVSSRIDGLGRRVQIDEVNKLTDDGEPAADFADWTTRYTYRADGALLSFTDSQGNVKTLTYDGLGRWLSMSDPDRGTGSVVYDDSSNVLEQRDAKGQVVRYTYDGLNRRLTEDSVDEGSQEFSYGLSPDVVYEYDTASAPVALGDGTSATQTNLLGRLAHVRDTQGDEFFSYDLRGRQTWSVRTLPDPIHRQPVAYLTAHEYDPMNRVTRLIYPDRDSIAFEYNERTLLRRIVGGPNGYIIADRTYSPTDQETSTTFGNGVTSRNTYDSRLRLVEARAGGAGGPQDALVAYRYRFDRADNITQIQDLRPESLIPAGSPRRNTQTFEYDSLERLTGYHVSHAPPGAPLTEDGSIQYRYDRVGNLLKQTSTLARQEKGWPSTDLGNLKYGGPSGRFNRAGRASADPGPHAVTAVDDGHRVRQVAYDANGNVVSLGMGDQLSWDFRNRLVGYTDADSRAEYRYDHGGRRVSKRVYGAAATSAGPEVTTYVGSHFEIRPNDEVVKYVFDGGRRVAQLSGRLTSSNLIQRVRLEPGWNLRALSIASPDIRARLLAGLPGGVDSVRLWNPGSHSFDEVDPGVAVGGGAILWIHALQAGTIPLWGTSAGEEPYPLDPGGSFLPSRGPLPFDVDLQLPAGARVWRYQHLPNRWEITGLESVPAVASHRTVPPGEALFVSVDQPSLVPSTPPGPRIRYYIEDHLGSQSLITDEQGALLEESAYFPYGGLRNRFSLTSTTVPYGFGGKERDSESGLHYFEARYLATSLARFVSVDPMESIYNPQGLNPYAFVGNRPICFADPSGMTQKPAPKEMEAKYRKGKNGAVNAMGTQGEVYVSEREHASYARKYGKNGALEAPDKIVVKYSKSQLRLQEVEISKNGTMVYKNRHGKPAVDTYGQEGIGGMLRIHGELNGNVMLFVQTAKGKIYVAYGMPGKIHHSTLTGGKAVLMAGELRVANGKVQMVNNNSGHYLPDKTYLTHFVDHLKSNGVVGFETQDRGEQPSQPSTPTLSSPPVGNPNSNAYIKSPGADYQKSPGADYQKTGNTYIASPAEPSYQLTPRAHEYISTPSSEYIQTPADSSYIKSPVTSDYIRSPH